MESVKEIIKSILKRLDVLEEWSHPPKDLCEFEDYKELDDRIKKLEETKNGNNN